MKNLRMIFILSAILSTGFAQANQVQKITIIAKIPAGTPSDTPIYVTGNIPELCHWNPRCIALKPEGNQIFRIDFDLALDTAPDGVLSPQSLEFKITRGSWDTEAADGAGKPYHNYYFQLDRGRSSVSAPVQAPGTAVLNIFNWKDRGPLGITGDLRVIPNFYSPQLGNTRTVRIWLPSGYKTQPEKRYPVIYAHDGQNLFDPKPSNGGVDWGVDEALTSLQAAGKIEGAIVVGLDYAQDRFAEYDYTQRGELYARFLLETIKPYVDQHYRTLPDRDHTFTMGSSMGAIISASLLWKYPEVFSKAAALSLPAFILNRVIYKIFDSSPRPKLPIVLYIDHGDFGGDAKYPDPAKDFVKYLLTIQQFSPSDLAYRDFPFGDHFEADWARRVDVPLLWLLKGEESQ